MRKKKTARKGRKFITPFSTYWDQIKSSSGDGTVTGICSRNKKVLREAHTLLVCH